MKRLVLALCVAVLAGCVSVNSNITRFHKLESNAAGQYGTYSVFIPDEKKSSLEFAAYLDMVKKQLDAHGFKEEPNAAIADYTAFFSYSVKTAGSTTTFRAAPKMAGNSAFAKGFNSGAGSSAFASTTDNYARTVLLSLAKFAPGTQPQTFYEAALVSVGDDGQINAVMPTLIKSLFQNFPGNSGETIHVSLPVEK